MCLNFIKYSLIQYIQVTILLIGWHDSGANEDGTDNEYVDEDTEEEDEIDLELIEDVSLSY